MSVTDSGSILTKKLLNAVYIVAVWGAIGIALGGSLAGCASRSPLTTGSIRSTNGSLDTMNESQLRDTSARYGQAYDKNPKDPAIGMKYATILSMTGHNDQALAVMQRVVIYNPNDRQVLAAYGKALAGVGQFTKALDSIQRAQTPDRPDWQLLSAEGAIYDQMGNPVAARGLYRKALDLKPNEPSILSNLGMSYLLQGDMKTSESYLLMAARQPNADSRVRQNLALVVGLQGRFGEAERIASAELSPDKAKANIAYLRSMLTQQNAWNKLKASDHKNTK